MAGKGFTVIIERDEEGWLVADVPELRGCHTQARTFDELIRRVKEVIRLCLEDRDAPKNELVGIQIVRV